MDFPVPGEPIIKILCMAEAEIASPVSRLLSQNLGKILFCLILFSGCSRRADTPLRPLFFLAMVLRRREIRRLSQIFRRIQNYSGYRQGFLQIFFRENKFFYSFRFQIDEHGKQSADPHETAVQRQFPQTGPVLAHPFFFKTELSPALKMLRATGRSKCVPYFFRSAGDRFTVTRSCGNGKPELLTAALTRSFDSLIAASASPTI